MKSSVRQTKIPFSERKLKSRNKTVTPKKVKSSEDENSPLKYKLVVSSESKIILRRSSSCKSKSPRSSSKDASEKYTDRLRSTPKRERNKCEKDEYEDCPTPSKQKFLGDKSDVKKTPENKKSVVTPSSLLSRLQLSSSKKSVPCDSPESDTVFKPRELFPSTNASSARKALYSSSDSLPCREKEISKLLSLLKEHLEKQNCGSIYIAGLPGTGKTASIEHVIQDEKINKGYHIVKINCTCISSSVAIYKRICSELKIKTTGKMEKDPKVLIEKYLLRKHKMILLILDEIDQLETRSQSVLYKIFEWPSWTKARLVLIGIANAMDLTDRLLPRLCAKVELKPVLLHFLPYSKDQIKKILGHRLSEVGADNIFTPSAIELISAKVAGMSGDVRRALDLGRRVVEISEENRNININCMRLNICTKTSPAKKIDSTGIDTDLLSNFLKINDCRRSPRKNSINDNNSKNETLNVDMKTPVKNSEVSFLSPNGKKRFQPKRNLFNGEINKEEVLREINYNTSDISKGRENESAKSPVKPSRRESPRKLSTIKEKIDFSVDSKDVLNVVKNIYGSSKALKSINEESSFPLHQKILICTFLLISKKGKAKDLNVGRLHQVYTKICTKRGITPVDLSGFLFLCRQVEMTGIMQIGKGPGKLAKIILQWDETEVTDALKDQNLLSSILDDVSCL